jgi:hypothetical protein
VSDSGLLVAVGHGRGGERRTARRRAVRKRTIT